MHDRDKIIEFYYKLIAFLNKIDAISLIKYIEVSFYRR